MSMKKGELAKMIDHGILAPAQSDKNIIEEIEKAKKYNVASVCIKPYAVKIAVELLKDTNVLVGTVVGFPHGSNTVAVKVFETMEAIAQGAVEIDMVVNIGKVLSDDWAYVENEISAVLEACRAANAVLKVIFENTYLQDKHKRTLCEICSKLGVDYVKTSTGFDFYKDSNGIISTKGAVLADCILMKTNSAEKIGIKAAGGIRTKEKVAELVAVGVSRIGTSATEQILGE